MEMKFRKKEKKEITKMAVVLLKEKHPSFLLNFNDYEVQF